MARLSLTRRVHFSAAHRYRRPEWDEARNLATFGKCARPNFHGHTYVCEITVSGPLDAMTGFVADLGVLDRVIAEQVTEPLDHANINLDIPEFAEGKRIPSSEELARWIATRVNDALSSTGTMVRRVQLAEEPNLWATWEADDA
jgi:6-pyruvoyltetrahydropterin/6-carboxytetrahydropterin synthase